MATNKYAAGTEVKLSEISEDLDDALETIDNLEEVNTEEATAETLADIDKKLKELENVVEEARKDHVESELAEHVEVGDSINGLTRRSGSRTFVQAPTQIVTEKLEGAGADPMEAMDLDAKKLEEVAQEAGIDPSEFLGTNEYTYFRR